MTTPGSDMEDAIAHPKRVRRGAAGVRKNAGTQPEKRRGRGKLGSG